MRRSYEPIKFQPPDAFKYVVVLWAGRALRGPTRYHKSDRVRIALGVAIDGVTTVARATGGSGIVDLRAGLHPLQGGGTRAVGGHDGIQLNKVIMGELPQIMAGGM